MTKDTNLKPISVAVGVLVDSEGRILITRRAKNAHQGGLWEFPGGKLEPGESVLEALRRELCEELGTDIAGSTPLMTLEHDYQDKQVLLDVHLVREWQGEPRGLEGQPLAWVTAEALANYAFPAANDAIVARLQSMTPLQAMEDVS